MALFVKKHWPKSAKIAGAVVFALLIFLNLQITTNTNRNGDINLLGLKLSLVAPTYASETYPCAPYSCSPYASCGTDCEIYVIGSYNCGESYLDYVSGYSGDYCQYW
jgi:hypothetical protein